MYYAVNTTKLFLLPPSVNIHPSYSRYSESNPNRIDYSKHNYSIQFNHTRIFCTTIFREPNFSLKAELTFIMKTTNLLFTVAHQAGTFFFVLSTDCRYMLLVPFLPFLRQLTTVECAIVLGHRRIRSPYRPRSKLFYRIRHNSFLVCTCYVSLTIY